MKVQMILVAGGLIACAVAGCSSTEGNMAPEPSPSAMNGSGPPIGQSAPDTGGELFNGNY